MSGHAHRYGRNRRAGGDGGDAKEASEFDVTDCRRYPQRARGQAAGKRY